jgi:polysaccharide pyruvyl transferase WcaK-like protein
LAKGLAMTVYNVNREIRHTVRVLRALSEFKLLIVSGGGQIDDYWGGWLGHPYTLAKWALLARIRGVRLVFLSVGHCALDSVISRWLMRQALRRADYRSFRDHGSKQLMAQFTFTRNDKVLPDLAFSYPIEIRRVSEGTSSEALTIGISPIAFLLEYHWPQSDMGAFNRYTMILAAFSVHLLREGHRIVLFATDGPDQKAVDLMIARIEKHHLPENSSLKKVEIACAEDLTDLLLGLDAAIVSRLHGAIMSHLCGLPVLAISYDRKVSQYMADVEQKKYCLEINTLERFRLEAAFNSMLDEREAILEGIRKRTEDYRAALTHQYDEIIGLVGGKIPDLRRPYNVFEKIS